MRLSKFSIEIFTVLLGQYGKEDGISDFKILICIQRSRNIYIGERKEYYRGLGEKEMKCKKSVVICSIIGALMLTGCNYSDMMQLTNEETEQVAQTTANLLLKYDRNYENTLVNLPPGKYYLEEDIAAAEALYEQQKAAEEANSQSQGETSLSVDEILNLNGMTLQYEGFSTYESYPPTVGQGTEGALPEEGTENPGVSGIDPTTDMRSFFSMGASQGKTLGIFTFSILNNSEADQTCDVLSSDARFRFTFNGSNTKNALTTILLNDLKSLQTIVPAGGKVEAVLVVEDTQEFFDNIQQIELVIKSGMNTATMTLQ